MLATNHTMCTYGGLPRNSKKKSMEIAIHTSMVVAIHTHGWIISFMWCSNAHAKYTLTSTKTVNNMQHT